MTRLTGVASVLRRHEFRSYLAVATLSRITGTMFNVAVVLLLLERTGSASVAGVVVAAGTLPAAVTGPLLGAWLDTSSRPRLLMVLDQASSALALAVLLGLAGHASTIVCALLAVGYGATRPLSIGGFSQVIPELVTADELPTANALESLSFNAAFIVGPLVSSLLAGVGGPGLAVLVEVLLTVAVALLIIATPALDRRGAGGEHTTLRKAWTVGLEVLWRHADVRTSVIVVSIWTGLTGAYVVLFPALSGRSLGGVDRSGALWVASSIGSVIGAFAVRRLVTSLRSDVVVPVSMLLAAGCIAAWTLTSNLLVFVVFMTSVAVSPAMLICAQIRQTKTPAQTRGTVFTTLGSINLGALAVGTAVSGRVIQAWSVATAVTLLAVSTLVLAVAAWPMLYFRERRSGRRPAEQPEGDT